MARFVDEEFVYQLWLDFIEFNKLTPDITAIADTYPETRSFNLDFSDIHMNNGDLSECLLDQPEMTIRIGESAINSKLEPDQKVAINLRINDLYREQTIKIRDIRAEHLSKLICVEGRITRFTKVTPLLLLGVFSCTSCGFKQEIIQDSFHFTEPLECSKDGGGCGKRAASTTFKFCLHESLFLDRQKLEIQEWHDQLKSGEEPQRLSIFIEDDNCGKVRRGGKVKIVGVIKAKQQKKGQNISSEFDIYMHGNSVEITEGMEEIEISTEEEKKIIEMMKVGHAFTRVKESIFSSLRVNDLIRETMTIALFGGVGKILHDGTTERGDLNIILVGDAGTGKSKILVYMSLVLPGGQYSTGKTSSAAGLGGGVNKEKEWGEGRPYIEPGKLALADMAICSIDEVSDLSADDIEVLKEAMESQKVTISKIASGVFWSRCPKILGDNPEGGYFKPGIAPVSQLDKKLSKPLLSRCDVILYIIDNIHYETDEAIARHKMMASEGYLDEDSLLTIDELRKIIIVARRSKPLWSKETIQYLAKEYANLRSKSKIETRDTSRTITPRQIDTIKIIATAYAKANMRDVSKVDVDKAFELFESSLRAITGGDVDINAVSSGFVFRDRIFSTELKDVILNLIKQSDKDVAHFDDILDEMIEVMERDISNDELRKHMKKMNDEGVILEVGSDLSCVRWGE